MSKLIIDKPYRVLLPDDIDLKMVQKLLTIKNKSIEFQIRRVKTNRNFNYEVPFWKEHLDNLEAQKARVLIFEDSEVGKWTYSGFANELSKLYRLEIENRVTYPSPKLIPWDTAPKYELRDYQNLALERLLEQKHGAVSISTGLGKTRIFINILKELGLSSLIVTPTTSIAEQVYNELVTSFGKKRVGFFGGTKKESKKLFTVAIAASLSRLEEGNEHYDRFSKVDVITVDESHQVACKTIESITMGMCKMVPYRFFFSATQTRTDGQEKLLAGIIGNVVIDMDVKKGVAQGFLAKPVFQIMQIDSKIPFRSEDPNMMERKHLLENPLVAKEAAEVANKFYMLGGLQTLILIDEFVQFDLLTSYLRVPHDFANSGTDVTDQVAKFNKGETPVLIGTSAIALGTDIQSADVLILIQKGVSEIKFKQAIGRGIRKTTKKNQCVIIDFDIANIPICHKHALQKAKMYEEMIGTVSWIDKRS